MQYGKPLPGDVNKHVINAYFHCEFLQLQLQISLRLCKNPNKCLQSLLVCHIQVVLPDFHGNWRMVTCKKSHLCEVGLNTLY